MRLRIATMLSGCIMTQLAVIHACPAFAAKITVTQYGRLVATLP